AGTGSDDDNEDSRCFLNLFFLQYILFDCFNCRMSLADAKKLMEERDQLDREIAEQEAVLQANNVDMKSDLIDAEGFPRADIDVYSVRHARSTIIRLRNDREKLTNQIGEMISEVHEMPSNEEKMEEEGERHEIKLVHRTSNDPFVKVQGVSAGSPADLGGIKKDDLIIQFDVLHKGNYTQLKQLALLCKENEDKTIRVTVIRDERPVRLEIRPRKWSADPKIGLLGCALIPV
ncbi:hypothetical protein PMAYCL1PPCAC_02054, partial [Pristionchus mayeri]